MMFRSSIRRLAHLVSVIVRHGLAHVLTLVGNRWPTLAGRLPVTRLSGPERLRALIEDMGGTFIKFGQMLALQPDILPLSYCNALYDLLDRGTPVSFQEIEKTLTEELGKSPREIFDKFETEPIASASIGQVHVAYLNGRKLAVKVQRPNAMSDFSGDIRLMRAAVRLIKQLRLKSLYWMIEPTSEFIAWTDEELDYRREAHYMEQHGRNAQHNPYERVPEVFWDFVSRRTLVVEFIDGVTVANYLRALNVNDELLLYSLKSKGFDGNQFVYNILENFLGDAYRFGMFHADLHPANLIILPGNGVGYIDFGITGVLSLYSRQNVVSLSRALGRGDLDGMCAAFFKISTLNETSDVEGFRAGIRTLADDWYEAKGKEHRLVKNATLVMLDMLKLSHKTGIYPERDVVKYIRSAIAIDGLITRVAPGFDLGHHLETISSHFLKWEARQSLFSYDSLVNWSTAGGHLMRDGAFRAAGFMRRIADGELPVRLDFGRRQKDAEEGLRLRAVCLGAIICAEAVLMTLTVQDAQLGANLFTAQVALTTAGAAMLWQTIRRLA